MQSIPELEALLKAAKKNESLIEKEEYKRKQELRKRFFATRPYTYEVTSSKNLFVSGWLHVEIQEVIYITQKINLTAYNSFIRNRGVEDHDILSTEDLAKPNDMQYYLTTDGIIHHTGGGTIILATPRLCSNAEWEQIKQNNIPTKFFKGENNYG